MRAQPPERFEMWSFAAKTGANRTANQSETQASLFVNADERPSAYLLGVSAIQRGRRKREFTG
jgi:hypothetical protein